MNISLPIHVAATRCLDTILQNTKEAATNTTNPEHNHQSLHHHYDYTDRKGVTLEHRYLYIIGVRYVHN